MPLTNYYYLGMKFGTHRDYDLNEIKAWCGEKVSVELNELYSNRYTLKKPMPITLVYEDNSYVIMQDSLNVWAEERTLVDTERAIAQEIIALYERLSGIDKSKLGPYPKELLSFLRNYIS